jgi:hypothetical protein
MSLQGTEWLLPERLPDADAPLAADVGEAAPALASRAWWRALHAGGFALGGTTFIAGTAALYPSLCAAASCALLSAALYTAGSAGFLLVDVLETVAFARAPAALRINIALSAAGSTLYVIGSAGFLPWVVAHAPGGAALGLAGFIAGSALIAASQAWKVARVLAARRASAAADTLTAAGVEGGAGVGAALFLAGTALDAAGGALAPVLGMWLVGSFSFTLGAACLLARHYVLGIA